MSKFKDLTGQRFGRLVVIRYLDRGRWLCLCDCGNTCIVRTGHLNCGSTRSCGCLKKEYQEVTPLDGQVFNRLTVLKTFRKNNRTYCECQCTCGNITIVEQSHLKSGHTRSCGCISEDFPSNRIHGLGHTRIYKIWKNMKQRCLNTNNSAYNYYGARGITVCNEWLDKENGFMNFYNWAMENGYTDELTIDRINNDGNYEPSNCRWVTDAQQNRNKRNNVLLEYNNETHCLRDWSYIVGINEGTIRTRIKKLGWSVEKTLTTPVKGENNNGRR